MATDLHSDYPVSSKVFLLRAISASTILMPTSLFGLFGRPNRTMCWPQVDKSVWGRMAFDFSSEFYLLYEEFTYRTFIGQPRGLTTWGVREPSVFSGLTCQVRAVPPLSGTICHLCVESFT